MDQTISKVHRMLTLHAMELKASIIACVREMVPSYSMRSFLKNSKVLWDSWCKAYFLSLKSRAKSRHCSGLMRHPESWAQARAMKTGSKRTKDQIMKTARQTSTNLSGLKKRMPTLRLRNFQILKYLLETSLNSDSASQDGIRTSLSQLTLWTANRSSQRKISSLCKVWWVRRSAPTSKSRRFSATSLLRHSTNKKPSDLWKVLPELSTIWFTAKKTKFQITSNHSFSPKSSLVTSRCPPKLT